MKSFGKALGRGIGEAERARARREGRGPTREENAQPGPAPAAPAPFKRVRALDGTRELKVESWCGLILFGVYDRRTKRVTSGPVAVHASEPELLALRAAVDIAIAELRKRPEDTTT